MSSVNFGGDDGETYEMVARKIVSAVAEHEDTDPTELEPSLYEIVDPDALNALFAPTEMGHPRSNGQVTVQYCGYEVTAYSDGHVAVHDRNEPHATDSLRSDSPAVDD